MVRIFDNLKNKDLNLFLICPINISLLHNKINGTRNHCFTIV